jgi:hypothetical protein
VPAHRDVQPRQWAVPWLQRSGLRVGISPRGSGTCRQIQGYLARLPDTRDDSVCLGRVLIW